MISIGDHKRQLYPTKSNRLSADIRNDLLTTMVPKSKFPKEI